ncbi:MAG: Fe-S cluster assembly protein SufD, partial [Synechococcales cyanobacterium RM1_1_8]|nr:Fe-S cluster assembly protein SufD [Synechococcales cyanobacterium RM1_1_8]
MATVASHVAQLPGAEEVFTTLNTATFADVAVVHVAKQAVVETPLHLLFVSTGNNSISQPRCIVVAEASSQVSLIEDYVSIGDGGGLCNAVTEIVVAANAQVNHSLIQREARGMFHIGKTSVIQSQDSRYTNVAVQMGAALSRHNVETHHQGTQVETNLYGLALVAGEQLADTHSNIQYNHPHCSSDQLYKAIATDKGRSVFSGRVGVPKAAQQTSAAQLNRNLLLSNKARIDTKPQLEIIADDVKCSHG